MPRDLMRTNRVPVKQLRRECDPRAFKFKTTDELEPLAGTVGQDRAVDALAFGLSIEAEGYNLYVSGPPGVGRSTELRAQLERIAATRPPARDWCYVFNFRDPSRPRALSLPADRGHQLSHDVDDLVETVRREVPRAFESDEYNRRREQVTREVQSQRERFFEALQAEAQQRGLTVNVTPMGIATVPLADGKPITREQYELLTDERKQAIQRATAELDEIIMQMTPQMRRLERGAQQLMTELDRQVMIAIAAPRLDELKREYASQPQVVEFLNELGRDMVEHIDDFRGGETEQQPFLPQMAAARDGVFNRYKVNVIVTHDENAHAPIVEETSPTYYHMFGRIDYRPSFGSMTTDHTMIKPGALHRANGGFLIVNALDVLTQPLVWDTLKRALRTRTVRLENLTEQFSLIPTASLTPEPIPLDLKVAMIGTPRVYQVLQMADEDFQKLFKARADFTVDVDRVDEHQHLYARFIAKQAQERAMRPFDRAAVAKVIEQSSRMVSDQQKLSLRLMDITDLLVEADYWACDEGSANVTAKHVEQAIERKVYRSSLIEERVQEWITKGVIKVDTEGAVVGQVNGLSVYDIGDYAFGRPSRITARVSMGRGQVVNLEREINKSGPAHSKGFLTLTGYLNGKFAHRRPLSFAASITFEQVYDEVDGDSAASTELYALLSAITDVPLRQGIAVTGSVNQLGDVQAIGGVNEKIEGFYAVCKARGLTGEQGVMIPKDNLRNLMLKPEVVQAVKDGKFHVWAVSSIDEGIELLTGLPAGKLGKDGQYPQGTVYRKVTDMLEELTRRAVEVNRGARDAVSPTSASPNGAREAERAPARGRGDGG
ncbi:MAG TPA: AAA family ATPase, partial [Dehalococcoidia bacterium]|nr:AAA family ATPase [Dehalococcoidia bacterium]